MVAVNAAPSAPSLFVGDTPARILDTRTDVGLPGPFVSGVSQTLQVTGTVPTQPPNNAPAVSTQVVPPGATSVVLNVTVVRPSTRGFISIRPGDSTGVPATSNINWGADSPNIANSVTVQLPATGTVNIYVQGTVGEVLVDVAGYYEAGPTGPVNPVSFFLYLDGGQSQEIGAAGPLSLVADCVDQGGGTFKVQILGKTTQNDDVVQTGNDSFDGSAAEGFLLTNTPKADREVVSNNSNETFVDNDIDEGALLSKSGHYIAVDGETTMLGVNYGGRDCVLAGTYTFRVPATP